jgi:hypothetical protein
MKPYFQGQIDVFCAIYAVLNGFLLTNGLRSGTAREIFHETLLTMSADRENFTRQLRQEIEYHDLVDEILKRETERQCIYVHTPFAVLIPEPQMLWQCLADWLGRPRRAVVLRFVRQLALPGQPKINHWSTAEKIEQDSIRLFDCSRDESALRQIGRSQLITDPDSLQLGQVYVDPLSIRCLAHMP